MWLKERLDEIRHRFEEKRSYNERIYYTGSHNLYSDYRSAIGLLEGLRSYFKTNKLELPEEYQSLETLVYGESSKVLIRKAQGFYKEKKFTAACEFLTKGIRHIRKIGLEVNEDLFSLQENLAKKISEITKQKKAKNKPIKIKTDDSQKNIHNGFVSSYNPNKIYN